MPALTTALPVRSRESSPPQQVVSTVPIFPSAAIVVIVIAGFVGVVAFLLLLRKILKVGKI